MSTQFTAAAQAIADHFKQAEVARREPFSDTFINPMDNDAVTANFVGIPVALLRALMAAQSAPSVQVTRDAERFVILVDAMLHQDDDLLAKALAQTQDPKTLDDVRALIDTAIRIKQGCAV